MKSNKTNPSQFANQAKEWLNLFLTPSQGELNTINFKMGLYRPKDVTPYMHVLVNHLPEFMERHQKFGLGAFSCNPVEKKNHDQIIAQVEGAPLSKIQKMQIPHFSGKWWEIVENAALR
ncbi:unnamed protein product [Rhizophagus irregularis]|nr:unnamed protein product [Rhizophagus irregularis]